jgi:MFS transporter, YNFM family, putative membrane transport protein
MPALGGAILGLGIGALALVPEWGWTAPACIAAGFGFFTLHNTLQVQATQHSPDNTSLTFSVFTAVIFVGQSVGVSLASVTYARLGEGRVFGVASAATMLLGLRMAVLLRKRAKPAS